MSASVVRADQVEIYPDRSNAFWSVVGIKRIGVLSLLTDSRGERQVLLVADDETFVAPLVAARSLGPPPAPFGIKKLAGLSMRLDLAGDRRIVSFTGLSDDRAIRLLNRTQQLRLGGGLPSPTLIVDTLRVASTLPGIMGRSRASCSAWKSILSDPTIG